MDSSTPKPELSRDEITPQKLYLTRRQFLKAAGVVSASAFLAACLGTPEDASPTDPALADVQTKRELAENFNNYYEFSLSKTSVAEAAKDFNMQPWQVEVDGLVRNPKKYTIEEIVSLFPQEERVYRMRCVEGWSMVLPWQGFPLARLLEDVEPLPEAQYVGFMSILRPEEMPGQTSLSFPWPYLEGLRLDEARYDLTILATGLYGEALSPQNGGPIRLVVPWKYGFKSLKAVVRITLQADQPVTFWNAIAPQEYGFYANVNPSVDHPRWTQSEERRIGETGSRPTLLFNGYDEVAPLYEGMDLRVNF
ncbi:MAG: protein-methionine-sulfoxide reductase catalytic subunit MsrP [Chloroflexi bacterium]|jgi:sulfoxide reductase catalytic subunit YedY|nr:protein-methionine-sulfoxide reductase catalytic subunit MsrP [Anaerolineaceae bacterium]NLI44778.1 protein-methionine-sulfoxide reductase catalytic subunit MsrP [Chloroflexota bacterium]HOE35232.1 protein-methionine-sulfoxide reductase catalytic subunit MsrP [Anaerolineaceae bacterium]HOT25564.1 protein-methionine-sulfoxide reductase catalytic subunit MsrP [Anaerolineaceae bacterium]HQK03456.1 protein-methionine-sulfoxide reductase catalytic subunit MsrP [Anaerolineaceae bacterium]